MIPPTLQEAYDRIVKSAFDGTFPSVFLHTCRYREDLTPSCQQRCLVGLFLPDDDYDPVIETLPANSTHIFPKLLLPIEITEHDICSLQNIHDNLAGHKWDSANFIRQINEHHVFKSVVRVDPTTYQVEVQT